MKSVFIITPFFSPNVGGVEVHLDDLCSYLNKRDINAYVITYQPITVNRRGLDYEKRGTVEIHRFRWFGKNLLFKLEKKYFLNFLYISSGLFLYSLYFLIPRVNKVDTIHAQGINAASIAVILGKIFRKRIVVSLHTIYRLSKQPRLLSFVRAILNMSDKILVLGEYGKLDLESAGINSQKVEIYNYWVDRERFFIEDRQIVRSRLSLPSNKFIGLFVGRFVEQKGLRIVAEALKKLNQDDFLFLFIGDGPEKIYLDKLSKVNNNILYLGIKSNQEIVNYYNASDVLLWGSIDNSYLGRVCIEALYCGLPIIAPNHCRILDVDCDILPETLPSSVGFLVPPQPSELIKILKCLLGQQSRLDSMRTACRDFALKHYGQENAKKIIVSYKEELMSIN